MGAKVTKRESPITRHVNYDAVCPVCKVRFHVRGIFTLAQWEDYRRRTRHTSDYGTSEVYEWCDKCLKAEAQK